MKQCVLAISLFSEKGHERIFRFHGGIECKGEMGRNNNKQRLKL